MSLEGMNSILLINGCGTTIVAVDTLRWYISYLTPCIAMIMVFDTGFVVHALLGNAFSR